MILAANVSVYLKTTETCNLNCKHCFTSGTNGKKIFFSPKKTISFFERLKQECGWIKSIRYMFHGGEPLLAPMEDLYEAYHGLKNIFPETQFSLQTNLAYHLTPERRNFIKEVFLTEGFGTSWDYDIRFTSESQKELWENNVKTLIRDGHYITMIVSITKNLIEEKEPIEIIEYAKGLGFQNILFERITSDGNAKTNESILPSNQKQDEWLHRMFNQSLEYKTYEYIGNMLMSELARAYVNHEHTANRCRMCEQSLITINADGTIGGCPNTAPSEHWGHIEWPVLQSLKAEKRIKAIACESLDRPEECYKCEAFEYCNSDCNKLPWDKETNYCSAPKKIWQQMIRDNDIPSYKKLIVGAKGDGPHGI
ncbi:radical SAM/SPASM domain-containing protein [Peredibacter starrii]|uniref:SPASM domain-containing protein n=1 Tax=Peredibacter starrii TaxID=28202 RepID=A0AAX4HR42_9BACT|nr:radical SAM protein [Peredibacter starrii]WPU65633.1 SPASM domain-containing protein [Peredibacter starrii]